MKGLTIEQKAKAYDLALERAKKWYNAPNVDKIPTFGNRVIEEIFPELRKPEDEEIRKALIENFKFCGGDFLETAKWGKDDDLLVTDILAWLEKQGEQKQEENKRNLGGISSNWNEEDEKNLEKTIWYVEKGGKLIFAKTDKLVSWLKSLRPQKQWKPSDEQMEALKAACDEHWEPDGIDYLYTLYHDLKKL